MSHDIAAVFARYPIVARTRLSQIRNWIFEEAQIAGVGPVTETLKWGQPAYLTPSKAGTTIRLAWLEKEPERCQLLVHCQTSLVETWRARFGPALDFDGNRAVTLPLDQDLPEAELRIAIRDALTYYL